MNSSTRRSMLALLGSGLAGLAGCSGQSREGTDVKATPGQSIPSATDEPPTPDSTPSPTDTERSTPDHESLRWWAEVGENEPVAPAVADGTVYVGSSAPVRAEPGTPTGPPHQLFALDLENGNEQWTFETGPPVDATPVVRDGTIYAVSGVDFGLGGHNYRIDAVDATSGAREWQVSPENVSYLNLLAVTDGTVVLGSNDDEIVPGSNEYTYALDAGTGKRKWRTQYGDVLFGSSSGSTVYLPAPDGLYAVDSRTGEELWDFESDSLFAPAVLGEAVIVESETLVSLDATTGDVNWRFQEAESGFSKWIASPAGLVGVTYNGVAFGIDPNDGTERWQVQVPGEPRFIRSWRDQVIVGDRGGTIVWLDGETGAPFRQFRSDGITDVSTIVVGEQEIYVIYGERTSVAALDAENGTLQWEFTPGDELTKAVPTDDAVLVGSSNGYLYALDS